ncbi:uncharacterized protein [Leptinotarsa decemlineata]|uniref:uncharacterized protein n=1 Tax=Leptinotarsa decemlineata TaxID=7539 RepID=UPI003D30BB2E
MKIRSTKWVKYKILITILLAAITLACQASDTKNTDLLKIVKRNLLAKEREYLKSKPMSEDLRDFIRKMKKRSKFKRELDKKHLYVVKDGNIVPLSNIKTRDADLSFDNGEQDTVGGKYTVIPLIIPFHDILSECDEGIVNKRATKDEETTLLSTTKLIPTTLTESTLTEPTSTEPTSTEPTSTEPTSTEPTSIETTLMTTTSRKTTTVSEPEEDSTDDFFEGTHAEVTTKSDKLLSNVIKELMQFESETRPSPETSLCNVSGDWDSYAGGVQIRIIPKNSPHRPKVKVVPREPPMEGFLSTYTWNVSAWVPFKQASLIALTAVSNHVKKLATFIGECRICEGVETISGNWLMQRRSKSCKDREVAHTIISDVLRRNNIRKLQHDHLVEISASSTEGYDDN